MKENHNHQKKIAVINDISGFGRCSIVVALPIISHLKIQCCPLPTSIFSNHTGFDSFYYEDFTKNMDPYIDEWKKLDLQFDGISTGFLGSKEQISIVMRFFKAFGRPDNIVIVDPVMGDYGKTYPTYTREMCEEMRKLLTYADIITPNLTEACILTGIPYNETAHWPLKLVEKLAQTLTQMGPRKIVITGIPQGEFIANYCYEYGMGAKIRRSLRVGTQRSGTGDIFSAIISADAVNGVSFQKSVKKASQFIKKCIERSIELEIPLTDGVCFEEVLRTLRID